MSLLSCSNPFRAFWSQEDTQRSNGLGAGEWPHEGEARDSSEIRLTSSPQDGPVHLGTMELPPLDNNPPVHTTSCLREKHLKKKKNIFLQILTENKLWEILRKILHGS